MRIPIRFSIRYVLIAIACVAVGLTALRYANYFWNGFLGLVLLLLLFSSLLGILYRTGATRAAWVGTAIFGWAYFVLLPMPWFRIQLEEPISTLSNLAYETLVRHSAPLAESDEIVDVRESMQQQYVTIRSVQQRQINIQKIALNTYVPNQHQFRNISYRIANFVIACLGAMVATCFYHTRKKGTGTTTG